MPGTVRKVLSIDSPPSDRRLQGTTGHELPGPRKATFSKASAAGRDYPAARTGVRADLDPAPSHWPSDVRPVRPLELSWYAFDDLHSRTLGERFEGRVRIAKDNLFAGAW